MIKSGGAVHGVQLRPIEFRHCLDSAAMLELDKPSSTTSCLRDGLSKT